MARPWSDLSEIGNSQNLELFPPRMGCTSLSEEGVVGSISQSDLALIGLVLVPLALLEHASFGLAQASPDTNTHMPRAASASLQGGLRDGTRHYGYLT